MVTQKRPDPSADPFRPPEMPTEVACLHCGRQYESYLIEWREQIDEKGQVEGFWCCPTPGCGGAGFGFDILPTDPTYCDERGGWVQCDVDEEYDEFEDDDLDDVNDPWKQEFGDGDGNDILF